MYHTTPASVKSAFRVRVKVRVRVRIRVRARASRLGEITLPPRQCWGYGKEARYAFHESSLPMV